MYSIILYLLNIIQDQSKQISCLLHFICRFIPLKQWLFDDSHSPKYQKFKTDELPIIQHRLNEWTFEGLQDYYLQRYGNKVKPVKRRGSCDIPVNCKCPCCGAPAQYLYKNNGAKGQLLCKVCATTFSPLDNRFSKTITLRCPHCGHALSPVKDRKSFRIHKCVNPKCSYYLNNLKHIAKEDLQTTYAKNKYKLHYLYREFTADFFKFDLDSLPNNASSLFFRKYDAFTMGLCLTIHVNARVSLRQTAQIMHDIFGTNISHQTIANYARTAALMVKAFTDNYDYKPSASLVADETYIKVHGVKGYVWFVVDALSRSILGYEVSDTRSVGPCILALRKAFRLFDYLPDNFRFVADGFSAYPLAAQQFLLKYGEKLKFEVTQVFGLTNDDAVSKEFRPLKQIVERLNRTFKQTYHISCGYHNFNGASNNVALWVAYYNFLRPHAARCYQVLNKVDEIESAENMPAKWQVLILLGQKKILELQEQQHKVILS